MKGPIDQNSHPIRDTLSETTQIHLVIHWPKKKMFVDFLMSFCELVCKIIAFVHGIQGNVASISYEYCIFICWRTNFVLVKFYSSWYCSVSLGCLDSVRLVLIVFVWFWVVFCAVFIVFHWPWLYLSSLDCIWLVFSVFEWFWLHLTDLDCISLVFYGSLLWYFEGFQYCKILKY